MNTFVARNAGAIWDWWHRNFQSAEYRPHPSEAVSRDGLLSRSFSVARSLEAAAPMIPPTITAGAVITATAADTAASKRKPSIVRVIRVRRRRWACKPCAAGPHPCSYSSLSVIARLRRMIVDASNPHHFRLPFCTYHFKNSGARRPTFTSGSVATHSRA
ncbi:MAG: hypothetical protein V7609_2781 [Verrucomicrobiota bacterium]